MTTRSSQVRDRARAALERRLATVESPTMATVVVQRARETADRAAALSSEQRQYRPGQVALSCIGRNQSLISAVLIVRRGKAHTKAAGACLLAGQRSDVCE
jgi:hypothetical protein